MEDDGVVRGSTRRDESADLKGSGGGGEAGKRTAGLS